MPAPKLFVSYSWTSPDHEQWTLDLATRLSESGVDVTLDKWNLREGHDANAFMEKMVTDSEIKKVVLICDRTYVEKANARKRGVGTEAQIISAELYGKTEQDKFVALVREYDEEGRPMVPVYYKSRIHIDFSAQEKYSEAFDQLLRWIFDKPLYKKPELGTKPAFLSQEESPTLGTTALYRRVTEALKMPLNGG